MAFLDFFRRRFSGRTTTWKELGSVQSTFTSFGGDSFRSDVVRACIRPLADFTGKAEAKCSQPQIARILNERPNIYMNGVDFLKKVRTRYEATGCCMIFIQRDDRGKASGFYPVPYSSFKAVEYKNGLFIEFRFDSADPLTLPWADIAIVRKDYNRHDIGADENDAILEMLQLLHTTNQGIANAVKATANLRGILKNTKAILATEDVKAQRDQFVKDYLTLENEGGIASLDATQEFTPIKMEPTVASAEQLREFRENVQRYFGVNEHIVTSAMSAEEIESFYTLKIEPFLVALSVELTSKVFTDKERGFGNYIVYESNKLQFASLDKKISVWNSVVLYGGMTINEWRKACNMAPIEGGDELIRRLDADIVTQEEDENGED